MIQNLFPGIAAGAKFDFFYVCILKISTSWVSSDQEVSAD